MDPVSFPDPHRHAGHLVHGRGEQVRQGGADGHHRTAQRLPHQERMVTGFVRFILTRRELQRFARLPLARVLGFEPISS